MLVSPSYAWIIRAGKYNTIKKGGKRKKTIKSKLAMKDDKNNKVQQITALVWPCPVREEGMISNEIRTVNHKNSLNTSKESSCC